MTAQNLAFEQNPAISSQLEDIFARQKCAFSNDPMPSAQQRIANLRRLQQLIVANIDKMAAAVNEDFKGRSVDDTKLLEMLPCIEAIKYHIKKIPKWMKSSKRSVGLAMLPAKAKVVYQPLGVVGIISPWNYPFSMAFMPLIAALAAGNRAMIKVSEHTPRSAVLMQELIAEAFPEDEITIITGEAEVGVAFSQLPFDHLLFTGSTSVGKHIMRAAAENLTPVTLELGGKSPTIIGSDYAMKDAVERICFGKCLNAGQTCVAPDYVFCPEGRIEELVTEFTRQVSGMYPTMLNNPDYTSVVNERQHKRLMNVLADAKDKGACVIEVNPANEDFTGSRKMPMTLVLDVNDEMLVMQEELFGPVMCVKPYKEIGEVVAYINSGERPLALYLFDKNKANAELILNKTHSGGVCINDTMGHVAIDDMPFGGVGASGMGHYHGHEGFLTFSKAKGVLTKGRMNPTKMILPPYGSKFQQFIYKNTFK